MRVVGVRFKQAGKIYHFDPGELTPAAGDRVIVETARGVEMGEVAIGIREVPDDQVVAPLKPVVRLATEDDMRQMVENESRETDAAVICQEKIANHKLPMKLVDVEYTFDGSKIVFYFTADGRVDFRELVRDLASVFRTRIELRQIGVRDEAKLLGGLGPCGRECCCSSFLAEFQPVSIRMAKEQNLSLNPTKISGLCGRLMCCLKYEAPDEEEPRPERRTAQARPKPEPAAKKGEAAAEKCQPPYADGDADADAEARPRTRSPRRRSSRQKQSHARSGAGTRRK